MVLFNTNDAENHKTSRVIRSNQAVQENANKHEWFRMSQNESHNSGSGILQYEAYLWQMIFFLFHFVFHTEDDEIVNRMGSLEIDITITFETTEKEIITRTGDGQIICVV